MMAGWREVMNRWTGLWVDGSWMDGVVMEGWRGNRC